MKDDSPEEIWYYKFPSLNKILNEAYNTYAPDPTFQVVILKKQYHSPYRIWIRTSLDNDQWNAIPGATFYFWWKWFQGVKQHAEIEERVTEVELFEMVLIQNL